MFHGADLDLDPGLLVGSVVIVPGGCDKPPDVVWVAPGSTPGGAAWSLGRVSRGFIRWVPGG
jgi:hypothetical protein